MPTIFIWYPDKDNTYGHAALQTDKYHISFWPHGDAINEFGVLKAVVKGVPASLVFHQELDRHYEDRLPTGRYEIVGASDEAINDIYEEFLEYNGIDPADVTLEEGEKLVVKMENPEVSVSKTKFTFVPGNLPVDSYYQHGNNCVSICYALIVTAYEKTFSNKFSLGMFDALTLRIIGIYTVSWFESHIKKHWVKDKWWYATETRGASDLHIIDPNANGDVLTGEEVPPSTVLTPTTSPEIVATGVVSAPVVMAADEVPLTVTSPFFSETEDIVSTPSNNTTVPLIEKVKAKEKSVPTVVASPTPNMASYKEIGKTGIKYSRENLLGQGNFGSVYLGIYNDQQVAVKRIELKQSKKEEREADLQQNLNHENVLKIRQVEKDDDFRYIVLERCAGTLGEVIEKKYKGPSYPSDPIVLYQIADGLNYIHSQKLIHRDIKPDNILISMNGQQLKLSDFGLSKKISTQDTCSMSGMKGTLFWMAPELRGHNNRATPKCDVFPCGCVFFVFLTRENGGIHPFGDMKDHLNVQNNIRDGKPINIDKLKADHYAVKVIQEMIKANPLERINLANVKKHLHPFCNPNLCTSTKVESA